MDRSPRRAGAAGAGAPPSAALRSFAISMAIAIVATHSQVLGFTIPGRHITVVPESDLTGEASSLLEVKYKTGRKDGEPNNAKPDDFELNTEVIAMNKTVKNVHDNNETSIMLLEQNPKPKDIKSNLTASSRDTNKSPASITIISNVNDKFVDNITAMQEGIKQNVTATNETTTYNTILPTNIAADNELGSEILKNVNLVIASTVFDNVTTEFVPATSDVSATEHSARPEYYETSSEGSTDTYSTQNYASFSSSVATDYMNKLETTNTGPTKTKMYTILDDDKSSYIDISDDDTSSYTDISESTAYASTPTWKTYTIIDRKHDTTTKGDLHVPDNENMVKSETAQTRITLENIINMTTIPSLENFRQRFGSLNDEYTTPVIREDVTDMVRGVSSKSAQISTVIPALRIGIVSSKRGGYLDNTGTKSPLSAESTTIQLKKIGAGYETENSDNAAPEHKNTSGVESQSQLVEDAIKEELLKEEILQGNQENANHYTDNGVNSLNDETNKHNFETVAEIATYDPFSVKPIVNDKKINASLYAVNPNYKPLKKIDVQPSKQFVRDPDDNSWRNESISSLGIVFKAKNSSKSFKQVLRNKTETELNNTSGKDNKDEVPDLRVRLEKIAEVRKSKKKKTNKFGEVVYTDYDSGENTNSPTTDNTSPATSFLDSLFFMSTPVTPPGDPNLPIKNVRKEKIDIFNMMNPSLLTTVKPKKYFNSAEYYDTADEYDADYLKVTKIDLKKFTTPIANKEQTTTQAPEAVYTTQLSNYLPERWPTVQYFPPTKKVPQKMNVEDYKTDFQSKLNLYKYKDGPKNVLPVSYGTVSPSHSVTEPNRVTTKLEVTPAYKQENIGKNLYLTHQPGVTESRDGYAMNDGNFNRASYVIKHYKDFINEAVKDSDDDTNFDYLPFTESPMRGVTIKDLAKFTEKDVKTSEEDYEYELQYRKDLINRFVDNFNQNSERFKVDFPVLYNNSVVHRNLPVENSRELASSSAYFRRQYEADTRAGGFAPNSKPCGTNCDKLSMDLLPDYELHYYVPEQEQKEQIDNRQFTPPYSYRNTRL